MEQESESVQSLPAGPATETLGNTTECNYQLHKRLQASLHFSQIWMLYILSPIPTENRHRSKH